MNRRRFLSLLGLGVAGVALEQAIPLGRVWSFPSKIIAPTDYYYDRYMRAALLQLAEDIDKCMHLESRLFGKRFAVGDSIRVRMPQHFLALDQFREFTVTIPALTTAARLPS